LTTTRNLLEIGDLADNEIAALFERASAYMERPPDRSLDGRICANLFFEQSTRTQVSFQAAQMRLGAHVVNLSPAQLSLATKGESLEDTAVTLRAIGVELLVARHPLAGAVADLASAFAGSVINAGDGTHAHPTQGLLDAFTLTREFGSLRGRRIAFVGDIRHSRVAHSSLEVLARLGAELLCVGPEELLAEGDLTAEAAIERDLDRVLPSLDAIVMLRIQRERFAAMPLENAAYIEGYQLTQARLAALRPEAVIMHPGPYNRGVEIVDAVTSEPRWRYREQVRNGVYIRMALLHSLVHGFSC